MSPYPASHLRRGIHAVESARYIPTVVMVATEKYLFEASQPTLRDADARCYMNTMKSWKISRISDSVVVKKFDAKNW